MKYAISILERQFRAMNKILISERDNLIKYTDTFSKDIHTRSIERIKIEIKELEQAIQILKLQATCPVLATVDFVYMGEHEERGHGRPFFNRLTNQYFYRKDLQRYFTDKQIATIEQYGG